MPNQIPLTICATAFSIKISTLMPGLWQLTHQTVDPLEILVISPSPDSQYRETLSAACAEFAPLVRVIEAPQYNNPTDPTFGYTLNASRVANVGIKQAQAATQFMAFIGAGILFSPTSIEALGEMMSPDSICESQMTLLPAEYEIGDVTTLWDRWDDLIEHLDSHSRSLSFAPGSLMAASREWYFKVHGFDETNYPMSYNDSDLHRRARLSGIGLKIIPWGKMQMVHIIHPRRYQLQAYPDGHETNIIANGEHWGEIEVTA